MHFHLQFVMPFQSFKAKLIGLLQFNTFHPIFKTLFKSKQNVQFGTSTLELTQLETEQNPKN